MKKIKFNHKAIWAFAFYSLSIQLTTPVLLRNIPWPTWFADLIILGAGFSNFILMFVLLLSIVIKLCSLILKLYQKLVKH